MQVSAYNQDTERLLGRLDSVLVLDDQWEGLKHHRLSELHKKATSAPTIEEQYWANKNLYIEYSVFNADSAMAYANRNHEIATRLGDRSRLIEWDINRSFLLSATGLLKEAEDVISRIDVDSVPPDLLSPYYNQLSYLYSHFGQYSGAGGRSSGDYYARSRAYQDSTFFYASQSDPLYLWYKGWCHLKDNAADTDSVISEIKAVVDSSRMETRTDAMMAYILARLYSERGDQENNIKYLTISAICDIKIANKDMASLQELGRIMINDGNIDRAFNYVNYCQRQAQAFNNRVRSVTLVNLEKRIREAYGKRDASQRMTLHATLAIMAILLVVLIVSIIITIRKNKRLDYSQRQLSNLNKELNANLEELTELRKAQDINNTKLKEMNTKLSSMNMQLKESNIIKEEYVGQMFSICSDYINKLESLRKDVSRKLKVGQIEEAKKLVASTSMVQNELKEFYRNFDTIFLNIFPDFVKDFNKLLRPGEQITLAEGELLNTPLRIYALVRLGITDSVKIAALLHCSVQTVYNNRLRIRNKACVPKEHFAETVRTLGKFDI